MVITISRYSSAFFIPTILTSFHYTPSESSDRFHHRYAFIMGGIVLATIGYIILLAQGLVKGDGALPYKARYMAVFFVVSGTYVTQPIAVIC